MELIAGLLKVVGQGLLVAGLATLVLAGVAMYALFAEGYRWVGPGDSTCAPIIVQQVGSR